MFGLSAEHEQVASLQHVVLDHGMEKK